MKILLVSPNFDGHCRCLERLVEVIRKHLPFCKTQLVLLDNTRNKTTDPMEFVLQNARDDVIYLNQLDWTDIKLIIYDFFAIAGLIVGRERNIRTICSIPAILSESFGDKTAYFQRCYHKWKSSIDSLALGIPELASDGWLFTSKDNIVWTYEKLFNRLPEKPSTNFHFVGSGVQFFKPIKEKRNVVYMSLGTVVPTSIYNTATKEMKKYITDIYQRVIDYFGKSRTTYELIVSSPLDLRNDYSNVKIVPYCDQSDILAQAKLFITHGGGNGINEAIFHCTPMLVIPFFGDQFITARYLTEKKIGISFACIDAKDFDHSTQDIQLCDLSSMEKCLEHMLNELPQYTKRFPLIKNRKGANLIKLLDVLKKNIHFDDLWKPNDLLYGTTVDRKDFVSYWSRSSLFHIAAIDEKNNYITVDKLHITPSLNDQWNDLLKAYSEEEIINNEDLSLELKATALDYRNYLIARNIISAKDLQSNGKMELVKIIAMCCAGMDYFLAEHCRIHFVIDMYDPKRNLVTFCELTYIVNNIGKDANIILWLKTDGEYIPFPITKLHECFAVRDMLDLAERNHSWLKTEIERKIAPFNVWLQSRIKKECSIMDKLLEVSVLDDVLGFRIIYPWTKTLQLIAALLENSPELNIIKRRDQERGKVIYLFGEKNGLIFEIQFWPSVMYTCFESEHDTIYKKPTSLTEEELALTEKLRESEHQLQDIIDANYLIKI
ncbi:MAG: hypothetical protein Harvfovirus45_10 [Harvfovirus sp.]|uniref:Glycosyltransferase n=1 Tax=Harvfovirus sp. TaxID=2487768 RepID=A0A3G5A6Z0_9VIRU|nr:MAG: hypothetical protein Harvfovirus45_10 [Harvfovirus sp.]